MVHLCSLSDNIFLQFIRNIFCDAPVVIQLVWCSAVYLITFVCSLHVIFFGMLLCMVQFMYVYICMCVWCSLSDNSLSAVPPESRPMVSGVAER